MSEFTGAVFISTCRHFIGLKYIHDVNTPLKMKRILIALLFFLPIFSFGQVNLKNGLVACYPFNANAVDISGNGNNGIINGATLTADRFGNTNSAYSFNGTSDFIEISPSQLQTTQFSYSLWVKPSSIPAEGIAYFLFSVGSESGDQDLSLNKSYANANDGFTGGGYLSVGETVFCQKGTSPNVNQWYHLVFVRETNVYKVYLDGNLMCTTSMVTKPPFYGTGVVAATIGSRRDKTQFAHCVLDDISLYNRAITSEEVTALYQITKSPATVDLKKGLVACYPFNANAKDESGNNNNGTVNGATLTTDRFGKANSAYNFDGSSYISVSPDQFKNQTYTYATWVYLDKLPADGENNTLIAIGGPGGDQVLSLANNYATVALYGFQLGTYNIGTPPNSNSWTGVQPDTKKWYHVVGVRDNTSVKLYINGILNSANIANANTGGTSPSYGNSTTFIIGSRGASYVQAITGVLDDIYIYNRPLSPEEVTALYQTTKSPATVDLKNGLVACYPFNGNAFDETKNGHNGTVNGATLTTDRFGKANSSYSFDGNSFIQLANPNDFKNNNFTYSAWVNIPVEPSSASYLNAYSVISIGNGQVMHFVNRPEEGLVWGFTTYNDQNIGYDVNPSSTAKTTLNTWHHFVISRSATQAKIYVDGVLIATATSPSPSTATYVSSNPAVVYQATIGTRPDENNIQFFNGSIDDIYIYNRVITPEEVIALFQSTKSIPCEDGMIACHPFSVVKTK